MKGVAGIGNQVDEDPADFLGVKGNQGKVRRQVVFKVNGGIGFLGDISIIGEVDLGSDQLIDLDFSFLS